MNIKLLYKYLTNEKGCIQLHVNNSCFRIDKYLFNTFKGLISRNKIQKFILQGKIKVNHFINFNKNLILKINDIVQIITPIIINKYDINNYQIKSLKIDLNIVYEDDDVLVLNKPAGLVVHPGNGNLDNTLLHGIKYYFNAKNIDTKTSNKEFNNRLGLVNRLDKYTSGLILLAKNMYSYEFLKNQFIFRKVKKKYLALTWGIFKHKQGIINYNIGRSITNRIKMQAFINNNFGKKAITKYIVLINLLYFSFIKCDLYTGRTHQIRVHLNSLGHPVFNDVLYGGEYKPLFNNLFLKTYINNCFKLLPQKRHCLHSSFLQFIHPKFYKKITVKSNIPQDMLTVLLALKKIKNHLIYV